INPPPQITGDFPAGRVNQFYRATVQVTGGTDTSAASVSSGALPPGIALSPPFTDVASLEGRPTTTGSYTFTVRVTDRFGIAAQRTFTLAITDPPRITTVALPPGIVGTRYQV